jgi:predicted CXXCH cytochrome family protein
MRSRLIVLLVALVSPAQDDPNLLAPPDGAVFAKGPVRFIARADAGAAILLDGKPLKFERPAEGVATANLDLEPGAHEISLDKEKVRFFVGAGAPREMMDFRFHPPMASCSTCHAIKNGAWTWQRPSLVTLCGQCHDREKFPAKHTHEMGILADCQICHNPHGSTAAGHLRKPKETACKQCHS